MFLADRRTGALTTVHNFDGPDGASPYSTLTFAAGNFYGTTQLGGTNNAGTVFTMTPSGVLTTLHSFSGPDGAYPTAGVVRAADGRLYGVATYGGSNGHGTVYSIDASRFDAGTAYAVFDFHQVNNRDPYAYKTTDYGKTWKLIVNGIPKTMLSYAHAIKEDPVRQGLLYLGTEGGMFVSFDAGERWEPLQLNLPHAPVYGMTVQEHFNDLVIATYGRGFWILDDLTPLQQLNQSARDAGAHLFTPRAAYRFQSIEPPGQAPAIDMTAGQNPPYGASINYWLKAAPCDRSTARNARASTASIGTFAPSSRSRFCCARVRCTRRKWCWVRRARGRCLKEEVAESPCWCRQAPTP